MKNIQFIGTQRSGSNLLRVMLHELPDVCAPHPPHILQVMRPFLPMYGNLQDEKKFMRLIDDVCQLVEKNPVNWNIAFDRKNIRERCAQNSLPQIAKAIYETKAIEEHATWWCCKSMANIHFVDELEAAGIKPFYLYLYRDGRDVALSFLKAIVGEKHIYHLAQQWRDEQMRSLELCARLPETRYFKIDYETFVAAPEITLQHICAKTGIAFSENALKYNQSEESRETAASGLMWSNLTKPVMKDNTKKYLTGLSAEQIEIFERVAGDALLALGYPLETSPTNKPFSIAEIEAFNTINQQAKSDARKQAVQNDLEKRAAQDTFITSLREQFAAFVALTA